MKLIRYHAGGRIAVEEAEAPACPDGGLVVETEACGLCSGELMTWYLDLKAPHVLGHEVAGRVVESQSAEFPVGCRVAVHHHAPCGICDLCRRGAFVHCATWKRTRLVPGGMATRFAVSAELLADTRRADDVAAVDAALMEPLACVMKQLRRMGHAEGEPLAVIGLGVMGLMHMLVRPGSVGYDVNPRRLDWARGLGLDARHPDDGFEPCAAIVVLPGSAEAMHLALTMAAPDAVIGLFSPLPPGVDPGIDWNAAYFRDVRFVNSYSCGPNDTQAALEAIRAGRVRAEMVVERFGPIEELPALYDQMKSGEILKAMVTFGAAGIQTVR